MKRTCLRLWTLVCVSMYAAHVAYLSLWSWDYGYNMAANVALGIVQNMLWTWFSVSRYHAVRQSWATWPGLIVAWILLAMSLELLDFPPLAGLIDAHSLWHLGTVGPTLWWYRYVGSTHPRPVLMPPSFLVKDAQQDMHGLRLKA